MNKRFRLLRAPMFHVALLLAACSGGGGSDDEGSGGSGGGGGEMAGGKGGSGGSKSGGAGGNAAGGAGGQAQAGGAGGGSTGGSGGGTGGAAGAAGAGGAAGNAGMGGAAGNAGAGGSAGMGGAGGNKATLGFFITSTNPGKGGNLEGLDGADAHCKKLAMAVGAGDRTWRAYLSSDTVDARSRIGAGPWRNAKGVEVATSVDDLHSANNKLNKQNSLDEKGAVVNGRGDSPNRHDILTGSTADGRRAMGKNCSNWTSSSAQGSAVVGHHDRMGGGANPTSWNASHDSNGCGLENLRGTGGDGLFYCFAAD